MRAHGGTTRGGSFRGGTYRGRGSQPRDENNAAAGRSSVPKAFAKIPAHIAKDWFRDYTQREQDERRQKFKKPMPQEEEAKYKNIVTVNWPEDLQAREMLPKDAFGTSLERLDPIRMYDEVFIKAVGLQQLEIRGDDIKRVKLAEQHLQVLFEKVRITKNTVIFPLYILLDTREALEEGVVYERAEAWWPGWSKTGTTTHPIAPRLTRCAITGSAGEYWQDLQPEARYNIQCEIERALQSARYEKGYYDLSIRFGCVALKGDISKVGMKKKTDVFMSEIVQTKHLDFVVKNWLFNNEDGEEMLARLMKAEHLLEPTRFGLGNTLADSCPTLRGSWVFRDPDSIDPKSPYYVVQVHWTMDEDGLYEKEPTKFYRLDPEHDAPKDNMDVKLLELGRSKAWQFSLTSMHPISTALVPPALHKFAENTKVKTGYQPGSKEIFADFPRNNGRLMVTGRLDTIYTFDIKKTGYRVDVLSMRYPGKSDPCWGFNVYHSAWRNLLAELELMRPGEIAQWGDTVSTFLPDDGFSSNIGETPEVKDTPAKKGDGNESVPPPRDGIRLLLNKLMELSQEIFPSPSAEMPDYPAIPPSPCDRA